MLPVRRLFFTLLPMLTLLAPGISAQTSITGSHTVEASTLVKFVQRHNPDFDPSIAYAFINLGECYGIRGDIALCQAIIETGWFKFDKGTAVTPEMHNYCGLGVTRLGEPGCCFATVEEGVMAMLQHLYAYCSTEPLPPGEELLDPRFDLVARGCAKSWEDLSGRWAANPVYGANILALHKRAEAYETPDVSVEVIEVQIPDDFFSDNLF